MSRIAFLMREALVNLRRNALVVVGAVLAVFISLSLAFGALVLNELVQRNTLTWQDGTHVIAWLRLRFGQEYQDRAEQAGQFDTRIHEKKGTPTMGGILMIGVLNLSALLWT